MPSQQATKESETGRPTPPPLKGPNGEEIPRPLDKTTGQPVPCYITREGIAVLSEDGKPVPLKLSEDGKPIPLEKAYPHLAPAQSNKPSNREEQVQVYRADSSAPRMPPEDDSGFCSCCCGGSSSNTAQATPSTYNRAGTYTTVPAPTPRAPASGGNKVIVVPQTQYVQTPVVVGGYSPYGYGYGGYPYGYPYDPYGGAADAALLGFAAGSMMGGGYYGGWGGYNGMYDYW